MTPLIGVVMGSSSDWDTLQHAVQILQEFGVAHEARVVSAHRMPDDLFAYAESAGPRGLRAIIAGAGGAAHLPGMLAAKTIVPVLGVPVASRHLQGVDSLHSIVQMPKGIPVATFAIGQAGAANRKFALAVVSESKTKNPIILVQDYHFALLPKMIREQLPDATIITFWHIPWPNPESFAICPWRDEVLAGLLGSSILGFHTQFHCNNFVDTVDRFLEARVDRESFNVSLGGKLTAVRRYPISIAWPPEPQVLQKPVADCRAAIRQLNDLPPEHKLGIGVDRLDYTKGIIERFRAIERLLELNPQWIGQFTFVQIAAPTRAGIDEYQHHEAQVRAMATRINTRFARQGPPPIVLKVEHHEPLAVYEYCRAADLCFVSSLHDGMNLVAKEFVAARDDERGVLVLSQFTGAARELAEALIVNPYDADQCAAALHMALTMPVAEQRDRMRLMRGLVAEFNVFRWAGRMLLDAAAMRRRGRLIDKPGATSA